MSALSEHPRLGKIHLGLVQKLKGRPGALRNLAKSPLEVSVQEQSKPAPEHGLQRKHLLNTAFPDALLLAQPLPITRMGPSGARRALPSQGSSLLMLSPWPCSLHCLCPGSRYRCFPCASIPARSARAVAEGSHRGRAGDIKQRLQRSDSSSGLGLHTLSILRHLMTNNADKRVFLRS